MMPDFWKHGGKKICLLGHFSYFGNEKQNKTKNKKQKTKTKTKTNKQTKKKNETKQNKNKTKQNKTKPKCGVCALPAGEIELS